ncbi:hypothetical protein JK218_15515, partial [Lactiplantibacillus plantarum]|nr:hypothetical protein [Lactiplantibacillus plantarum]
VRDQTVDYLYRTNQANFKKIPGSPITYWGTENIFNDFKENKNIYDYSLSPSQNVTGNNKRFLRKHWEINSLHINKNNHWIFYAKGGGFRKWYGNLIEVINWSSEARSIYQNGDGKHASQIINEYYWYKKGITWGLITSSTASFRIMPEGATFDKGGTSILIKNDANFYWILALLNSKIIKLLVSFLNPTINYQLRDISLIPVIYGKQDRVICISKKCTQISNKEWDNFEISWYFKVHPLLSHIADDNLSIWYYSVVLTNRGAKNVPIFRLLGVK